MSHELQNDKRALTSQNRLSVSWFHFDYLSFSHFRFFHFLRVYGRSQSILLPLLSLSIFLFFLCFAHFFPWRCNSEDKIWHWIEHLIMRNPFDLFLLSLFLPSANHSTECAMCCWCCCCCHLLCGRTFVTCFRDLRWFFFACLLIALTYIG